MRGYFFLLFATVTMTAHAAHESCLDCHLDANPQAGAAALTTAVPQLCFRCHPGRAAPGEHRIDVVPKVAVPAALPLVNGAVSCTTCHDAHLSSPGMTRIATPRLCQECHPQ